MPPLKMSLMTRITTRMTTPSISILLRRRAETRLREAPKAGLADAVPTGDGVGRGSVA